MDGENGKVCPLLSAGNVVSWERCLGERCAFYVSNVGVCSIVLAASALYQRGCAG